MFDPNLQRLSKVLLFMALVVFAGTFGFAFIEGWPLFDCFYMTVITLSTVGYGETHDLTVTGRIFTSCLILFSMFSLAAATASLTSMIVRGDISGAFQKKKERKMISRLAKHTVVCGGGTLGQTVTDRLVRDGKSVVRILNNEHEIELARRLHPKVPIVVGEATNEMCLADAGIFKAAAVVAATQSDFDNLLITITCKSLGKKLKIYASADSTEIAGRILKVGADQVICPQQIGGIRIASLITTETSQPESAGPRSPATCETEGEALAPSPRR